MVERLVADGIGRLALIDRDVRGLEQVAETVGVAAENVLLRVQDVADEASWVETAREI